MSYPMQPVQFGRDGVVRFKKNKIVVLLLDKGPFDMNRLAMLSFSNEDREQFAQLIGYSVSGFGDLSYVSADAINEADEKAEELFP